MTIVCGIDEAGRGPVIGPLIITGVILEEKDLLKLKRIGVKDSKLLKHQKRIELSKKIKKIAKGFEILAITPEEIDQAVDGHDGLNLNWLEARKSAEIINTLNPDKAILDCPSPNISAYTDYIKKLLKKPVELIVDHKADFKYPIVGAASILAKVRREEEVEIIKKKYGNIGPGYPSNPVTQKFIKENWDKHPGIFRKSWVTWKDHKIAKEQKHIEDF